MINKNDIKIDFLSAELQDILLKALNTIDNKNGTDPSNTVLYDSIIQYFTQTEPHIEMDKLIADIEATRNRVDYRGIKEARSNILFILNVLYLQQTKLFLRARLFTTEEDLYSLAFIMQIMPSDACQELKKFLNNEISYKEYSDYIISESKLHIPRHPLIPYMLHLKNISDREDSTLRDFHTKFYNQHITRCYFKHLITFEVGILATNKKDLTPDLNWTSAFGEEKQKLYNSFLEIPEYFLYNKRKGEKIIDQMARYHLTEDECIERKVSGAGSDQVENIVQIESQDLQNRQKNLKYLQDHNIDLLNFFEDEEKYLSVFPIVTLNPKDLKKFLSLPKKVRINLINEIDKRIEITLATNRISRNERFIDTAGMPSVKYEEVYKNAQEILLGLLRDFEEMRPLDRKLLLIESFIDNFLKLVNDLFSSIRVKKLDTKSPQTRLITTNNINENATIFRD